MVTSLTKFTTRIGGRSIVHFRKNKVIMAMEQKVNFTVIDNEDANKKKWDNMANYYASGLNEFMSPTTYSLLPHLKLSASDNNKENPFKIMEVAVGDGYNSAHIISELIRNKESFEYYGIDIAQNMIDLATKKITEDKVLSPVLKNNKNYKIDLSVQNAEKLSIHKDESFDRYISSLCLMLIGSAENMLKESYRILKPNGIAAFSIWGDREKSFYFESFPPIFKAINLELGVVEENGSSASTARSNYYLAEDMKKTVALFKQIGFRTVFYWDINVAIPYNSAESWTDFMMESPNMRSLLKRAKSDEQAQKMKQILIDGLKKRFDAFVVDKNKPISHNNVCIVAVK